MRKGQSTGKVNRGAFLRTRVDFPGEKISLSLASLWPLGRPAMPARLRGVHKNAPLNGCEDENTGRRGQSLVEILIAVTLMAMGISFATVLIYGGQNILIDRGNEIKARVMAEEGVEAARSIANRSYANMANGEHGLSFSANKWQFSGPADYQGIFTRKISVADNGSDTKLITSDVSWSANFNLSSVKVSTLVTNWKTALSPPDPGDEGGTPPTGDWTHPVSLGTLDLGAGEQATDLDVINKTVYITAQASVQSKADIFTVNANNPSTPTIMDSLDVGASGLVSIDTSGGYSYGAAIGVIPDLKITNVSNPNDISLTSEFNVITFVEATAIFKTGNTICLAVHKTSFNGEFFTIDVTDPAHPSQKDVFEVNGDVNDIYVKGNLAFVANSRDDEELLILNVSNPLDITQAGILDIAGTTDGTSVFVLDQGNVLLGVGNKLYDIDATNLAALVIRGSVDVGGTINDIYVEQNLVFLATSNPNREFQVVDITNPATPAVLSYLNFPQNATGVDYENNIVYVSVRSNDALRIITSQ